MVVWVQGDNLDKEVIDRWKDPETLTLVHPKNVIWKVTTGPTGHRRCEVTFTIGKPASDDKPYTLVITDPDVEELFTSHPHGKYHESDIKVQDKVGYYWDVPDEHLVFIISLGEPYSENNRLLQASRRSNNPAKFTRRTRGQTRRPVTGCVRSATDAWHNFL